MPRGLETSFQISSTSGGILSSPDSVESSHLIKSVQLLHIEMGTEIIPPRGVDAKTTRDEGATVKTL